jgi:hypothetical protein
MVEAELESYTRRTRNRSPESMTVSDLANTLYTILVEIWEGRTILKTEQSLYLSVRMKERGESG